MYTVGLLAYLNMSPLGYCSGEGAGVWLGGGGGGRTVGGGGGGLTALEMVTEMVAVAWLPVASVATADKTWVPFVYKSGFKVAE
jgi:hypothetical protein